LLVKASGVGVFDELLELEVLRARRPGQAVAFWDVDAPATLERLRMDPADPFRALVPEYDVIFTYGGGLPVVRAYEGLGARRCVPIYNGVDPEVHAPGPPCPEFSADLGFLGNRLPDRETRVNHYFVETARALPERRFVLGGSGWGDKLLPENVRYVGHVYTHQHNAFNASVGAVLNVNRDSMANVGFSPATRVFEAAGAGACVITDAWAGIEEFFEPGEEILVAPDAAQVVSHLMLLSPERRISIGQAARRRVLRDHTYAQRAREIECALSLVFGVTELAS
jgi:spore maturation protein CgeB